VTTFAIHFKEHIAPRLLNLTKAEGFCIAHGEETFSNAHRIIMDYARKYGALHLSEDLLPELEDWVCSRLVEAIDEYAQ
jgi:hypothetical protein